MDVAVCVRYDNVELFAVREKIGGYDFQVVRRFAEEAEGIGFFLHRNSISNLLFRDIGKANAKDRRFIPYIQ